MNIVVIGGTGLIGSKIVTRFGELGHHALAASPRLGINTITGEGLAEALDGAAVVVDVSNSPSFDNAAVREFFETSTRNLLAAEAAAEMWWDKCRVPLTEIETECDAAAERLAGFLRQLGYVA